MQSISRDLRYAFRSLWKSPGFSIIAIITLALGIGASTAIFSVVNAVLLRPLPYANADRLVLVWGDMRNRNVTDFPFPPGDFLDLRQYATQFDSFAAVNTFRQPISGDNAEPEQIIAGAVTTNFFSQIGIPVVLGRDFNDADGVAPPQPPPPAPTPARQAQRLQQGQQRPQQQPQQQPQPAAQQPPPPPAMVILGHELWQRRYGGDPNVLGRSIDLGFGRGLVVGVLAPNFELLFPPGTNIERRPQMWFPMQLDPANASRINVFLRVIGRLKPGVSPEQGQTQLDGIAADLRQRFPVKQTSGLHLRLEPMQKDLVADVRPAILALMGAVIFVLLIACANVANLLLVRSSWREREFAVRSALGAGRWPLVRQMLAESLVIAGAGALLGLLLTQFGIDLLLFIAPENLPRIDNVGIDSRVLIFAIAASFAAAVVFGLIPALRASRPDVMDILRRSGRASGLGPGKLLRNGVIVAEVALSFVLLVGCGLMLRSFAALQRSDPGFDPNNVLTFFLPNTRARGVDGRAAFVRQLSDKLRALPGVQGVTAGSLLPLDGQLSSARWGPEKAATDPTLFQQMTPYTVLPGYFEAMKTRLIDGRTFSDSDNLPDLKRIVIDQRLATKAFPNESAVGKRLLVRVRTNEPEVFEIIGVVGHQRHTSLSADGRESVYFTDALMGSGRVARWAVRTTGDPSALAAPVRAAIAGMDPLIAIAEVKPMLAFVEEAKAQTKFALVLIAVFAAIAAILAGVGLYSVLSTAVRLRTAEMGVRLALGATPRNVFQLVVGQGLKLSAVGIGLGVVASFGLTRVISTLLVGVKATDVLTFGAMAGLFVAIAALASWLPARRAARLDPTIALREE